MTKAVPGAQPLLVRMPIRVQTYDIDLAGHVNNCVYVRWLEDLRYEILRVHYPLERLLAAGTVPIIHSTQITYHRSVKLFDTVEGLMWCAALGRATLTLDAEIRVGGTVCATATQRGILLEQGTTKPARLPRELGEKFAAANHA